MKFNVGDRVTLSSFRPHLSKYNLVLGATGTVMEISIIPFILWDAINQNHTKYGTAVSETRLTLIS